MLFLIHSGLLSFTAALFITFCGRMPWEIGRSVPVSVMNFGLVLLNIMFGIMNVMTHPEIWQ